MSNDWSTLILWRAFIYTHTNTANVLGITPLGERCYGKIKNVSMGGVTLISMNVLILLYNNFLFKFIKYLENFIYL